MAGDEEEETYHLEDAVENIGFGAGQILLLCITGGVFAADAMEILMLAFILPQVTTEFGINSWEASILTSTVFLGMLLGAGPSGNLADKYGRKFIIQIFISVGIIFAVGSALAPTYWILVLCRIAVGIFIAGVSHLSYSLFAECVPKRKRGFWMLIFMLFWSFGTVGESLLAWYIIPRYGWRWLVAMTAVPVVISLFSFPLVGESPKYFLSNNNIEGATRSLHQLASRNGRTLPPGRLIRYAETEGQELGRLKDLFPNWQYARLTFLILTLWSVASFTYYGIILLAPSYMDSSTPNAQYLGSVLAALSEIPGNITAGFLVDRVGRKPLIGGAFLICGICFIIAMYPIGYVAGILVTMTSRGSMAAAYSTIWLYTPEAYPTAIRSTAMGAGSSVARVAGMITPFVASGLLDVYYYLPFLLYMAASFVGAAAGIMLPVETKGLSLPNIHFEFQKPKDPISEELELTDMSGEMEE